MAAQRQLAWAQPPAPTPPALHSQPATTRSTIQNSPSFYLLFALARKNGDCWTSEIVPHGRPQTVKRRTNHLSAQPLRSTINRCLSFGCVQVRIDLDQVSRKYLCRDCHSAQRRRTGQRIVAECAGCGRGQQPACGLRQSSTSCPQPQREPQRRRKKLRAREPASSTSATTARNPLRIVAEMAGCMLVD